ncbi:hypothetical protein N7519_004888, partial [Penicillium mononematosum]|uniref:uncharacterized protein n=1 Tax=Penicillium mononematosum TaxID=268346 RepID=UPI002549940C
MTSISEFNLAEQFTQFSPPSTSLKIGTVVTFGITCFIATVFLALRYLQAFKLTKKIEIDLIMITLSYGVALLYSVSLVNFMYLPQDVSLIDMMWVLKQMLISVLAYLICPSITKMAILAVLFQINPAKVYRCTVVAVAATIFVYTLVLCIITGGPCSPLHLTNMGCLRNVSMVHAVLNIVSDLAVIIIPIPTIHGLHSSKKNKITVGCLLALGSSVVICSIARVPYMLSYNTSIHSTKTEGVIGIWSLFEINFGITCACAMRLKRLISTYLPRLSLFSSRGAAALSEETPVERHVPQRGRVRQSYQLHSIQDGNSSPCISPKHISVHQTFQIDEHTHDAPKLFEETPGERLIPKSGRVRPSYQLHSIQDGNFNPCMSPKHISDPQMDE